MFFKPHFFTILLNLILTTSIQYESIDLVENRIWMTCKRSLLSYRITANGNRKRARLIQQHFYFHWAAKCDESLRNGPKSDPT